MTEFLQTFHVEDVQNFLTADADFIAVYYKNMQKDYKKMVKKYFPM